jgi:hypothetical protein
MAAISTTSRNPIGYQLLDPSSVDPKPMAIISIIIVAICKTKYNYFFHEIKLSWNGVCVYLTQRYGPL